MYQIDDELMNHHYFQWKEFKGKKSTSMNMLVEHSKTINFIFASYIPQLMYIKFLQHFRKWRKFVALKVDFYTHKGKAYIETVVFLPSRVLESSLYIPTMVASPSLWTTTSMHVCSSICSESVLMSFAINPLLCGIQLM